MSHHALFHNLLDSGIFKDKLVAYYAFENNANDIHSTNNGTLIGSPTFPSGKNNLGINFGNNNDVNKVSVADTNDFSFTNGTNDLPFSISLWMRFDAFSSGGNGLLAKRLPNVPANEWDILRASGDGRIYFELFSMGGGQYLVSSFAYSTLNTWAHLVCTYDGLGLNSSLKMYLNGTSQSVTILRDGYTRMTNTTAPVTMGMWEFFNNQSGKHRGMIDEVAIWKDRELTGAEITQLYNAGAGKFYDTF
jgi:hypothetical protein